MKFFDAQDVNRLLTYPTCIALMKRCFSELAAKQIQQPVRTGMSLPRGGLAYMPCALDREDSFGAKMISVYPGNAEQGLPSHQGYVLMFDGKTGVPTAVVDACAVTEIRTAAASAAAADILARKDCHTLAIIGSGAQARTHLAAMQCVRDITSVSVWSYHYAHAKRFAEQMSHQYSMPFHVCETVREAVEKADLICTVSRTDDPLLQAEWISPGAHISAVGTCGASARDLSSALVAASRFYVDDRAACDAGSGNYLIPLREGVIRPDHIVGSIGDVISGNAPGRSRKGEITVFESLGLAAEDVICADWLYRTYG